MWTEIKKAWDIEGGYLYKYLKNKFLFYTGMKNKAQGYRGEIQLSVADCQLRIG